MSRSIRLLVVAFTLTALLGAPLASEAAPRVAGRSTTPFAWLWSVLTENGCFIDPFGLCASAAPVNTKEGCRIDPNGGCLTNPQATVDEGCHIDPFGLCASGN